MKKPKADDKVRKAIQRLRDDTDPRYATELNKIADSFERLIDGGAKGGAARAKKLSKKRRSEIARKAANARWKK